jgi:hypothetical protein
MFCFAFGNRAFTARRHSLPQQDVSKATGWVVMTDASLWGVAWAMFAATAGMGLTVAAIALVRSAVRADYDFAAGYNALAPHVES